jgi:Xaa-Pro aminopeptidase
MDSTVRDEAARAAALLDAQAKAEELFVAAQPFVVPGVREQEVSNQVRDLAAELFGVDRHWHKRIVRSGPNTLHPYKVNPPDREITDDDIVFFDFGPVFAEWEADFGRTYVVGDDPVKLRLRDDLAPAFEAGKRHFEAHPDITGAELYAFAQRLAVDAGWEFGGEIAGHLVGEFPHERISGDSVLSYIAPGNPHPMRGVDPTGRALHWILEIHFVDRERRIGGFYEELLTL